MNIKIYKHKKKNEQIIITNEKVVNRKTDEKFVLYKFRGEKELFLMPLMELKKDYEQVEIY